MMMSSLEYVVICTMSNVREKSGHVTYMCDVLFGNVAYISNHIDDIIIRTCQHGFGCENKKKGDKRRRQHIEKKK